MRTGPTLTHRTSGKRSSNSSAAGPWGTSRARINSAITRLQIRDDPFRQPGIGKSAGTQSDKASPHSQVLFHIIGGTHSAHSDDGNVARALAHPSNGKHTDREKCRTADPSVSLAQ